MKVLNIIGRRPTGGIGTVVKNYQYELRGKVDFDYLLFSDQLTGDFDKIVQDMGSSVFISPYLKIENYFKIKKYLKKFFLVNAKNYDIFHIHSINIGFLVIPLIKKYNPSAKIIAHAHATKYSEHPLKDLRNRILCYGLEKKCDYFHQCSVAAGQAMFKEISDKEEVYTQKNAIYLENFKYNSEIRKKIRKKYQLENKYIIGHVGRFCAQKNHKFILEIFKEYLEINPQSQLILIGTGEDYDAIQIEIDKLNLKESVLCLGQINNVNEWLQAFDIFIMPSLYEGLPLIGIEAQASGLPCLFSDRITKEVGIINSEFLSINDVNPWKYALQKYENFLRTDVSEELEKFGFNIKIEAKKLFARYIKISQGDN